MTCLCVLIDSVLLLGLPLICVSVKSSWILVTLHRRLKCPRRPVAKQLHLSRAKHSNWVSVWCKNYSDVKAKLVITYVQEIADTKCNLWHEITISSNVKFVHTNDFLQPCQHLHSAVFVVIVRDILCAGLLALMTLATLTTSTRQFWNGDFSPAVNLNLSIIAGFL